MTPALMDSVREGESADDVKKRLGKPAEERWSTRSRRVRQRTGNAGTTTHVIEPTVEARFVRLNVIRPSYSGEPVARIYEFEVYGPDGRVNLALHRPATGSLPCSQDQGPEKAVNGSVSGGQADRWCAEDWPLFLQVDLGAVRPVTRFIVKHASAGGENEESDTREFNIQLSNEGKTFTTVASSTGAGFVEERTEYREIIYFDGRRAARLLFEDGKLQRRDIHRVLDFEEDRAIFAGIFQYFYLRLAIFFGCLGIFMYLFRGGDEQPDAALLVSRAGAARGAARGQVCCRADCVCRDLRRRCPAHAGGHALAARCGRTPGLLERRGMGQVFWYAAAAVLGCVGLRERLSRGRDVLPQSRLSRLRLLLAWQGVNGIFRTCCRRSASWTTCSPCVPAPPMDDDVPTLIRLLAALLSPRVQARFSGCRS